MPLPRLCLLSCLPSLAVSLAPSEGNRLLCFECPVERVLLVFSHQSARSEAFSSTVPEKPNLPTTTWMSFEVDLYPIGPWDDSPDTFIVALWQTLSQSHPLLTTPESWPKKTGNINVCCVKSLRFGVMCYIAIDNQYKYLVSKLIGQPINIKF